MNRQFQRMIIKVLESNLVKDLVYVLRDGVVDVKVTKVLQRDDATRVEHKQGGEH